MLLTLTLAAGLLGAADFAAGTPGALPAGAAFAQSSSPTIRPVRPSATPRRPAAPADPIQAGIREAQGLLRLGRIDDGLEKLRELARAHPENWMVLETLGRAYEATDRFSEAVALYRDAADRQADPGPALIELQRLYRIAENWDAALAVCLEYLTRSGDADAWVADEVESLVRTDRVGKEAIRLLEAATRERPDDLRLKEILLAARLFQGDEQRAMADAEALDRAQKARGSVLFRYANLAQEKGKLAAAVDGYDRLLRDAPAAAIRDQALYLRGQALRGLGRYAEAAEAFAAAGKTPEFGLAARLESAEMLAGQLGRPEEALVAYGGLLQELDSAPRRSRSTMADRIRLAMAELQIRLGRPGEAAGTYREMAASAADPAFRAEALYRAGEMFFFQGKLKEAEDAWYAVTDSFPGQKWVNDALEGVLLLGENNDEGGVPLAAFAQARYQQRLGRHDRGLELIDEALRQYPQAGAADDLKLERTRLLLALGRVPEARAEAESLSVQHPDSRFAPRGLLEVAERLKADRATEAEGDALFLEILMRHPESLEAARARAALQRTKDREAVGS